MDGIPMVKAKLHLIKYNPVSSMNNVSPLAHVTALDPSSMHSDGLK